MPIYTFSVPDKRPDDKDIITKVKEHCERRRLNFSGIVVDLLKQYAEEQGLNGQRPKV